MSWKTRAGRESGPGSYVVGDILRFVGRTLRPGSPGGPTASRDEGGRVSQPGEVAPAQPNDMADLSAQHPDTIAERQVEVCADKQTLWGKVREQEAALANEITRQQTERDNELSALLTSR